ncbi:30S ribosomal protein S11 [Helicobacter pylori]
MAKRNVVAKKKVVKKNIARGVVYISATFNNTNITITDEMGNVICWSTAGGLGFKGSKKSTPYAAQQAVESALSKAKEHGVKEVGIKVQGPGSGRETAIKSVGATEGVKVLWIKDITPFPHNGCRPPKRRRV